MPVTLRRFTPSELWLDAEDTVAVLRFFWADVPIHPGQVTTADREFAQSLLVEAIDGSYAMGYIDILFRAFYGKIPVDFAAIRDMVKEFAKEAAKHWFRHATQKDLADPKIYENVRASLARNFRSTWKIREQTGELTY